MDKPLGIADVAVLRIPTVESTWQDHYVWCRLHTQARKITGLCPGQGAYLPVGKVDNEDCILVGPFMSECEANFAGGLRQCVTCWGWIEIINNHDGGWCDWLHRVEPATPHDAKPYQVVPVLGMKVDE